jgi:aspartate aminotransferase
MTTLADRWLDRFSAMRRELGGARSEGARRWGGDFADLGRSEPLAAWPPDDEANRLLAAAGQTRRYPPVAGRRDVLDQVAAHYSGVLGTPLTHANILLTPGALTGITLALMTLGRPGGEVAVPAPYYHAYPSQAELTGHRPRVIATGPAGGWRLTAGQAGELPAGTVLLLANPANPATVSYSERQLGEIISALPPDAAVIADEVYGEYLYQPGDFASLASLSGPDGPGRWLVVRSAAKTLGRPGLRIGVLIGPAALIGAAADRAAALLGGVSVPAQLALAGGLRAAADADHMRPYRRRAELALELAGRLGLTAQPPGGTYYLWLAGPGLGRVATARRLATEHGVFVWPGEYFGWPTHARVSLSAPVAAIQKGLARIGEFVNGEA